MTLEEYIRRQEEKLKGMSKEGKAEVKDAWNKTKEKGKELKEDIGL